MSATREVRATCFAMADGQRPLVRQESYTPGMAQADTRSLDLTSASVLLRAAEAFAVSKLESVHYICRFFSILLGMPEAMLTGLH